MVRAVVLHALVFPAEDMLLRDFEGLFPSPTNGSGGSPRLPGLPYTPCTALPVALESHLAPRPFTQSPGWTHAVADDGLPLQHSEHAGMVGHVLADALRLGAALPGLLSPSDAALALFTRQHFCVNLEHRDHALLDVDDVVSSDRLARIAHECLERALPPEPYGDDFRYCAVLQSLRAEMTEAVRGRP